MQGYQDVMQLLQVHESVCPGGVRDGETVAPLAVVRLAHPGRLRGK
jgi:hypothetical protein